MAKFIYSFVSHLPLPDFFKNHIDINECEGNSTNICNTLTERCENTEGSYQCICLPGFRKNNSTCKGNCLPCLNLYAYVI